jgi:hypothetical protein
MRPRKRNLVFAGVLAVATAFWASDWTVLAADHLDPPARTDPGVDSTPDKAADIADVYMWHSDTDLIIAVTFAGPSSNTLPATYDRDILYTINISNAGLPTDAEIRVQFRFAQDANGNWGIQLVGLPDGPAPLVGAVEQTLARSGMLIRAGLYDDPFFFDLQGFKDSKSTGNLSIRNDRNFFTGLNDTAIVLQFPIPLIKGTSSPLNVWVTTARFGGQL